MARFLIHHCHEPHECGIAYASFKGSGSALRHRPTLASCEFGRHEIWWTVDAPDEPEARRQLPFFVAQRSTVTRVADVVIP